MGISDARLKTHVETIEGQSALEQLQRLSDERFFSLYESEDLDSQAFAIPLLWRRQLRDPYWEGRERRVN